MAHAVETRDAARFRKITIFGIFGIFDLVLLVCDYGGQEDDRRRALDAGFDRHLTKPIDIDALSALLQERPN